MFQKKHGFTLIELLVVIAIIAILAAILFPVFAKAREKARQTTCTNNQKQIATAATMYAQDNNETFPGQATFWQDINVPAAVTECPTYGVTKGNGYGYNIWVGGDVTNAQNGPKSLGAIPNPSDTVLTADAIIPNDGSNKDMRQPTAFDTADGPQAFGPNVLANASQVDLRHGGKCIAGFADGHVDTVSAVSLKPTPIEGVAAWFDASDGYTEVTDDSGNTVLYEGAATSLNGLPELQSSVNWGTGGGVWQPAPLTSAGITSTGGLALVNNADPNPAPVLNVGTGPNGYNDVSFAGGAYEAFLCAPCGPIDDQYDMFIVMSVPTDSVTGQPVCLASWQHFLDIENWTNPSQGSWGEWGQPHVWGNGLYCAGNGSAAFGGTGNGVGGEIISFDGDYVWDAGWGQDLDAGSNSYFEADAGIAKRPWLGNLEAGIGVFIDGGCPGYALFQQTHNWYDDWNADTGGPNNGGTEHGGGSSGGSLTGSAPTSLADVHWSCVGGCVGGSAYPALNVAEAMVFDHALSDGDRAAVQNYLMTKYSLPLNTSTTP